ncbi:MAG: hypothetical protein QOF92_1179 [Pseudonocardiales bacterium]|nr:hypothetical protein [Pseudonocardiales bacterium]
MGSSRVRTAGLVGLVVVLAAGAGIGGYAETHALRAADTAKSSSSPASTPAAYAAAGSTPSPVASGSAGAAPRPAAVAQVLAPGLSAPGLGKQLRARVVDVRSGTVLYDRGGAAAAPPASTAKVVTAAALFAVRKPTDRITTSVVAGRGGAIVLVGAGDPTLTAAAKGASGAYPGAARITDLAAQLRAKNVRATQIVVDDSLFSGPTVSPNWAPEDVPSTYASAITAVLADGGRAAPGDAVRSAQPDLPAAHALAAALGNPGLPVSRAKAPTGAAVLARVESAPLATLVEQMLQTSDNVIAECLARQVALAEHTPASFAGAAAAVRVVVRRLGTDPGPGLLDGSGLAAGDRVSPAALAGVLRTVSASSAPALHSVASALPVAAWSGTLASRYRGSSTQAGAGVIRAKTGTLTGVSSLVGLVHDRDGRLLAFAFIADRTGATPAAEAALDVLAARLAGCGCR